MCVSWLMEKREKNFLTCILVVRISSVDILGQYSHLLLVFYWFVDTIFCIMSINPIIIYVEYSLPVYPVSFNFLFCYVYLHQCFTFYVVKCVGVFISGFWVLHLAEEGWATNCLQGTFISIFSCSPGPQGLGVVLSISTRDKKKKGQRRQVTYLRSHRDFGENLELELGFSESQGQATTPDSWGQWVMPLPTHSQHSW